jgi:hypothetical protein
VYAAQRSEIFEFASIENSGFGPVMSVFMAGKPNPYGQGCINKQRKDFELALRSSTRVVIIGVNLNMEDKHLWDCFNNYGGTVACFNPEGTQIENFKKWAEGSGVKKFRGFRNTFEKAVPILEEQIFSRRRGRRTAW